MTHFLLSETREQLPEAIGEVLTIDVHYPIWIADSQRIAIELAIENCFSAWLTRLLVSQRETAEKMLGEDYDSLIAARNSLLDSLPDSMVPMLNTPTLRVQPGFVLFGVEKGGHKTRKTPGFSLWVDVVKPSLPGILAATVGAIGGGIFHYVETPAPQKTIVATAAVCTRQTARNFVIDLSESQTSSEMLQSGSVDGRMDQSIQALTQTIAAMPNDDCHVTVTASVNGETVATFIMTRERAQRIIREASRNPPGR